MNDHDGSYPSPTTNSNGGYSSQTDVWSYTLWPYLYSIKAFQYPDNDLQGTLGTDKNVFNCPVTKYYPTASFKNISVPNGMVGPGARMSYAMNVTLATTKTNNSTNTPFKAVLVQHPSQTALVLEAYGPMASVWGYHNQFGLIPHRGGSNILYCDGHMGWLVYKDIPPYSATASDLSSFWTGN